MKKPLSALRVTTLLALCAGLSLLWFFPIFMQKLQPDHASPGAQRQLITVWLRGDTLGAAPWLRRQAASYQKTHPEARIWVRTASDADMQQLSADFSAAPALVLFAAGEEIPAAWVSELQPLCMAGYALVAPAGENAAPAPTSLFGVTPVPEIKPAATPVPVQNWPERIAADNEMGAYFLQLIGAPGGAMLLPADELPAALTQGKAQAALLSTRQIRALNAQGVGVQLLRAVPGSDLVLYAAVMQGGERAATGFLRHLISADAQRALAEYGLFSAQGVRLYGANTPVLQAVEEALSFSRLPDALTWPQEKKTLIHTAQALYK